MNRSEIQRLLRSRRDALEEGGGRLIHKRPPKPGRVWRTYEKPGPVTVRKTEEASRDD